VPDEEIKVGVATVKRYKAISEIAQNGEINVSKDEKAKILRGIKLMNASTNDVGDLIFKPCRMCGYFTFNVPITVGMMLAPPTIMNTVLL